MLDRESVKARINEAFASVEYPGDWCLRGSDLGDEPYLLEEEFKGKMDWRSLAPEFLDQAPDGYGSALSFFSDQAFRFYLAAYLIADLNVCLERTNPVFHLCHGLDDSSRDEQINPKWYGERTWYDHARYRFSMFTLDQAKAIVAYLRYKCRSMDLDDPDRELSEQALRNYWLERVGET